MKRDVKKVDSGRRNFIGGAAAAGAGTLMAAAIPASAMATPAEEASHDAEKKGYRLSQHVLDYYKSMTS
ncbi:MAG: transcriptional initiation protein Tat [Gammaproteobacteria bacterium]|nr:transcriptional initiation protein Tat [Gammaproteobacteria bacterium]